MRALADWLRLRLPFVVHTRRTQRDVEKNAFILGRDYERGLKKAERRS